MTDDRIRTEWVEHSQSEDTFRCRCGRNLDFFDGEETAAVYGTSYQHGIALPGKQEVPPRISIVCPDCFTGHFRNGFRPTIKVLSSRVSMRRIYPPRERQHHHHHKPPMPLSYGGWFRYWREVRIAALIAAVIFFAWLLSR